MREEKILVSDIEIPKKKIGGNHAVSETIKLQFGEKNGIHCFVFKRFQNCCCLMGPLQLAVTWYKIRHAGEQAAHWNIQNKASLLRQI